MEEINNYEERVANLFASKSYPSVHGIIGSSAIQGCWTEVYNDGTALIEDHYLHFKGLDCETKAFTQGAN
jgi:hypothetical protein